VGKREKKKREGLLTQKGRVVLGFRLLAIFNEEDQAGGRKRHVHDNQWF
jgi:hypothetical protein